MAGEKVVKRIVSDDGLVAAEVVERADGRFQFRRVLKYDGGWHDNGISGIYADAATTEEYALAWLVEESTSP